VPRRSATRAVTRTKHPNDAERQLCDTIDGHAVWCVLTGHKTERWTERPPKRREKQRWGKEEGATHPSSPPLRVRGGWAFPNDVSTRGRALVLVPQLIRSSPRFGSLVLGASERKEKIVPFAGADPPPTRSIDM